MAKDENKIEMKAPNMVKVRAIRPIVKYVNTTTPDGRTLCSDSLVQPGEIVEVSEELANEYCKPIKGHFAFEGERYGVGNHPLVDLTRAVRV